MQQSFLRCIEQCWSGYNTTYGYVATKPNVSVIGNLIRHWNAVGHVRFCNQVASCTIPPVKESPED